MVKLFCALVGAAGSAFSVRVDESDTVDDLKDAIKKKNTETITCDARRLKLYLATKSDDAWMTNDEADSVSDVDGLPHLGVPQAKLRRVGLSEEKMVEVDEDDEAAGNGLVNVLVVVPAEERVDERSNEERDAKRQKVEEAPDIWMTALHDEQVDTLPLDIEGLQAHLERELRVKIPITDRLSLMVSVYDNARQCSDTFNKLFEPCQAFSVETGTIVGSVIKPMTSGSEFATEDTYHHLWDSLIAIVLRHASIGNFRRNSNASTSTGLCRPDLCFYYAKQNVCVFRGEEKSSGEMQVPLKELYEKLIWRYDDAPYVFGYAAVGFQVCLVVIRKDSAKPRGAKAEVINHYDLSELDGRLTFLLALLNLSVFPIMASFVERTA
jgi:Crinkler effector protein N-terminal domain